MMQHLKLLAEKKALPIRFSDWEFYIAMFQQAVSWDDITYYNLNTGMKIVDNAIKKPYKGYVSTHMLKKASKLFVKITTEEK